ncbi:MAG: hypothetical protein IH989_04395 [Planctomycetes bacterium]|nr:hypothetical protein [Planctomycetota bacterium]
MTQSIEQSQFPIGTPVCVKQQVDLRDGSYQAEVVGVVELWEEQSTGAWFAHSPDHKLHLKRLRLRKADGEQVLLVIADSTEIAKLEGK